MKGKKTSTEPAIDGVWAAAHCGLFSEQKLGHFALVREMLGLLFPCRD